MKNLVLLFVVAFISGCVGVASVNPVGTEVVKLDSDDWDGVWSDGDKSIYYIRVKDEDKGILHIGVVDEKDGKFVMKTFDAHIKSANNEKFCNIQVSEILVKKDLKECPEKLKKSYYWMLLNDKLRKRITILLPDADKVQKAAKDKKIKAPKGNDNILLEGTSEDVTKFIQSYKNGELYIWKHPLILQRIMEK